MSRCTLSSTLLCTALYLSACSDEPGIAAANSAIETTESAAQQSAFSPSLSGSINPFAAGTPQPADALIAEFEQIASQDENSALVQLLTRNHPDVQGQALWQCSSDTQSGVRTELNLALHEHGSGRFNNTEIRWRATSPSEVVLQFQNNTIVRLQDIAFHSFDSAADQFQAFDGKGLHSQCRIVSSL